MYPSLSEYVCTHAGQMTDITTLKKYAAACKKNEMVSYEYSGVYCSLRRHAQDYIGLIDDPMKEWFATNGLDYGKWFSETNAHCQWMVRHLPDTYGYVFHHLLSDVAKKQLNLTI